MAAVNVNVTVITGNLTRDPELRSTGGGTSVCEMRVAVNSRRKNGHTGQWESKANYFNVVVFGVQADNCATYLRRGRPVAVEGRLDYREWDLKENGVVVRDSEGKPKKRSAVQIIANSVQFLGSPDHPQASGGAAQAEPVPAAGGEVEYTPGPGDEEWNPYTESSESDFGPVSAGGGAEDDIPF